MSNKMFSTEKPDFLHTSGGVHFFNLNAELIPGSPATDNAPGTVDQWASDSVAIEGEPTRAKLIAAGMQARYSKDDEISIINKKLLGDDAAYATYSAYREAVKQQVTEAGFPSAS